MGPGMRRAFWQGVNRWLNIVSGTVFTGLAVRLVATSPK
ncbi:threonine/homoserine/homoserine lactone efflux protein [Streptomyces violarus]|uniref:Threonine/homoserine/homoserine lactone efflux protein n=1 Tax=Streptomyces violarus TaxID=67380 RepID=A0A7W5F331_9ACTN|nr:threonine/homoserine/homoserine lactone efflux protein [Streptomyces violarus]